MPFTDINTVVCATVRKLRNIYLEGRNEEVEISRYGLFIVRRIFFQPPVKLGVGKIFL